ncbi:MCE family protein [Thermomonospora cellulosilytica]|uniref:Phospholipid/cholesterol/gamma-HCH transport system substrate-binding protein n=1 Tax=Thermomonospora cellulosilytica TaxID=1411118 RepID=A0A7W3R7R3_9ACTN|nr:MCE family protein [Thermomonospora cellulosilytica]MBA9002942.1 phospholipid/cholesterol/gamma-HCH transport system substrate-binding protein [Thermomonospora cellulosilytica]
MNHNRRIVVNLVFFGALGVVLAIWAASSLIDIDALRRPVPVTADFASSPGLNPGLEVTHLGVRVGKVGAIELKPGHAEVRIDLDRHAQVPSTAGARVMRKSAIGEPYIELTPPPASAAEPRPLRAGDHIPLSRTAGGTDYRHLFRSLGDTLDAVDPEDARTLVHETATALEGRDDSLRDLIADTHRLTGTLAAEASTLDALSVQLTQLTGTLADHRWQLASGVQNLATVTGSIRQSRQRLDTVLEEGPGFLEQVNKLLSEARPGLDCLLTAVSTPSEPIFSPRNEARIDHLVEMVPTLKALVSDITVKEGGHRYARVMPVITIAGSGSDQGAEFAKPRPRPTPRPLSVCPATEGADPDQAGAFNAEPGGGKPGQGGTTALRKTTDQKDGSPVSGVLPLLPPLLGALVVIAVGARTLRTLIRRRSGR